MNPHNCDTVSQECRNLNGSFECICKDGYREVEGRCDEIVLWPSYGNTSLFEKVPAGQSRKVDIPVSFPYFGKVFSSLMVYPNGFVSFGPYEFTDPTPGPASWPNSPPLFSVYWADIVFGTRNKDAGVWIEQASLYDDVTASPLLLTKVKERTVHSFNPVWATAVTWVHAQPNLFAQYPNDRASFQLILATDGEESYAVLNYDRVWPNTEYAGRPRVSYAYSGASGAYTNHDAPADKTKQVVNLFNGTASPSAATYQCLEKLQAADAALNRSLAGLPICPCLKLQAETDRTFKASTTPDSDPVCYNSRFWKNDAKQTCCYSRDYGLLISNGDGAGYPEIKVATGESSVLKTAFDQCCNLTCHLFYRRYPTSNCSLYEAPKIGAGFGDPHLETFDGNKFTFNGWGDFTVFTLEGANNVNIQLQGRTDKTNGQNSTFFTAYAFRMSPDSDTYYFKMLEGTGAKTIKGLWKNDTNLLSSDNYDIDNETEKIIFDTSAGVSVTITLQGDHLMHTVIVQSGLGYTTKGLMGTLNGNKADDFLYSSGTSKQGAVENLSGEDINSFAKSWRVKEADSLFNYSSPNLSYDDVNKHENFELPVLATSVAAVLGAFSEDSVKAVAQELCGNNLFCLQDYFLHQKNDSAEEVLAISNSVDQEKGKLEAAELVFKNPAQVSANAPGNMSLTVDSGVSGGITFSLQADSPFGSLDGSNFVWNITNNEEALRALKYPQMLQFFAKNTENVTGKYRPTIKVCLCDDQTQCSLNLISAVDEGQDPTGNVVNVVCDCGDRASGRYCTVPVDPCKNCFNESSCNNTLSEDYCQPCPSGYEGDGFVCRDINECLDNSTCEHHCNNTDGSYECSCNTGYTLQGSKCIDVNECLDNSCGADSYCVNTLGSSSCQCYPGLIQSGPDTCVKLKEIYNGSLVFTSINDQKWSDDLKDDKSEAFSKLATKVETAIKTSVNQSAFKELVPKVISFTQVPAAAQSNRTKRDADPVSPDSIRADFLVYSGEDPITTTNIDDALINGIPSTCTNNCGYNGLVGVTTVPSVDDSADVLCSIPAVNTCDPLSTDGCYEVNRNIFCNCSDGFTENFLDPSSCEDIDECATLSSADCNDCLNIAGSYSCSCPNGQAWDSLLSQCKDTPCRSKPCKNGGECHLADTASGFSCSCTSEYEGPTCEMEDDEFRRMKVAVICVSVILGVFCFILLIVLIVMCVRQRKSESDWTLESHSYTNSRYGDFGGLPRPKVRDVGSAEMAENGSSNVYDNPASVSDPDNRYTSFGKKETGPESKYVYKNNAYDETEGAKL
ncbi:mucin-like protein [Aplysia californica]|uniref:Mucin-like protein n=1 Tax=Aplysia californica TaxID=6500 RepID=A0ABM0ZVX9_APLCA|nr:mucin-like protein [Aplysia californica]